MTLEETWRARPTPTDKVTAHSYLPIYDRLLGAHRDEPLVIVEVGVREGGSLMLWRRYFPNATIIGIDNDPAVLEVPDCFLYRHDSREKVWAHLAFPNPEIDVLIDDGDHDIRSQLDTLAALRHAMKPGGRYFVEDIYPFEGAVRLIDAARPQATRLYDLRDVKHRADDVLLEIRF